MNLVRDDRVLQSDLQVNFTIKANAPSVTTFRVGAVITFNSPSHVVTYISGTITNGSVTRVGPCFQCNCPVDLQIFCHIISPPYPLLAQNQAYMQWQEIHPDPWIRPSLNEQAGRWKTSARASAFVKSWLLRGSLDNFLARSKESHWRLLASDLGSMLAGSHGFVVCRLLHSLIQLTWQTRRPTQQLWVPRFLCHWEASVQTVSSSDLTLIGVILKSMLLGVFKLAQQRSIQTIFLVEIGPWASLVLLLTVYRLRRLQY